MTLFLAISGVTALILAVPVFLMSSGRLVPRLLALSLMALGFAAIIPQNSHWGIESLGGLVTVALGIRWLAHLQNPKRTPSDDTDSSNNTTEN